MNILSNFTKRKRIVNKCLSPSFIALGTTFTYLFGKQLAGLKEKFLLSQDDGVIIYEIDHSDPESGIKEYSFSEMMSDKEIQDKLVMPHIKFNMKYFLTPLGYMQYLLIRDNHQALLTFSSSPRQLDLMGEYLHSLKFVEKEKNNFLNTVKI